MLAAEAAARVAVTISAWPGLEQRPEGLYAGLNATMIALLLLETKNRHDESSSL